MNNPSVFAFYYLLSAFIQQFLRTSFCYSGLSSFHEWQMATREEYFFCDTCSSLRQTALNIWDEGVVIKWGKEFLIEG